MHLEMSSAKCRLFCPGFHVLIKAINKGSVPYCGSNNENSTWIFLSEILFSLLLKNISSAMHVAWYLSLVVWFILPLLIPLPCRKRWCKECKENRKNLAFDVKTLEMSDLTISTAPKCLSIVVNRLRYINNFTKTMCSIPMDMTDALGLNEFKRWKNSIVTIARLWNLTWMIPKILYCLCSNV